MGEMTSITCSGCGLVNKFDTDWARRHTGFVCLGCREIGTIDPSVFGAGEGQPGQHDDTRNDPPAELNR
jgi:hypothetical protein